MGTPEKSVTYQRALSIRLAGSQQNPNKTGREVDPGRSKARRWPRGSDAKGRTLTNDQRRAAGPSPGVKVTSPRSSLALGSRFRAHPAQPSRWTLDYDPFAADLDAGRALMRSELVEHREADVGFLAEPLDRPAYALQFRYCSGALFAALAKVVPHSVPQPACMTAFRSTLGRPPEASSNGQRCSRGHRI